MRSGARTDYREFADQTRWIIAQDGWQEVADSIKGWLSTVLPISPERSRAVGGA